MQITAVLFDLDGTLLDRRATFERHVRRQIERHPGMFAAVGGPACLPRLVALDANGYRERGPFYGQVETELGLPSGSAATLLEDFERHFPEECVPLANVDACLADLRGRGLRLGLITNGRTRIQGRKIDGLGLRERLDAVLISESVGCRKPDRRIFDAGLAALGVPADAAAYVGDNPDADVRGAKNAGLAAIWRRDPFWPTPAGADHVIDDLLEIPAWLDGRGP